MVCVKKWSQLFVRDLSREVFLGETVDFLPLGAGSLDKRVSNSLLGH